MFLLAAGLVAPAQQPTLNDPLLDSLTGHWLLTGEVMGQATTHEVDAAWVLNHQYVRLHEISREKNAAGLPQYEACVYIGWDTVKKQYIVHWIDVYGGGFSLRGTAEKKPSLIAMVFKAEDGSRFLTNFIRDEAAHQWRWTMDSEKNGSTTPFARLKLTPKK